MIFFLVIRSIHWTHKQVAKELFPLLFFIFIHLLQSFASLTLLMEQYKRAVGTKSSCEEEEEAVSAAFGVSLSCIYLLPGPECIMLLMCNHKWLWKESTVGSERRWHRNSGAEWVTVPGHTLGVSVQRLHPHSFQQSYQYPSCWVENRSNEVYSVFAYPQSEDVI